MGSDRTNAGDGGDRSGDAGDGQLRKVISGASQSSFDEVFEAWGKPPSRKQEVNREVQASSRTAVAEQPEPTPEQSEKQLKGHIEKVEHIKVTENNEKPGQVKNSPPYDQPAMQQVFSKPGESLLGIAKRLAPDNMSPTAIEEWAKQNLNRDGNNVQDINKVLDAGTKITLRRYENESLNTEQFGMMAVQGNPVAQAVDQMLKTPEAQDQAIRDGIKRDGSNVLVDWFKERFQDVTNVVNGFDKWVASTFSANKVKETFGNAVDGIKKAAFGQHDGQNEPIRDEHGDLQRKGVSNPRELAEYGVSTAVGATKTMNGLAHGLTPKGFTEGTHAIAEGGRQAIKNAAEYYGEHGVSDLPADTADAARSAYDQLAKWSTDRMNMEPGERGHTTGSAMAMMFFVVASSEFVNPKQAAKRAGVTESELAGMTAEQLEAKGIKRIHPPDDVDWSLRGKTTYESVIRKLNDYLLDPTHIDGGPKAKWLKTALGFDSHNSDQLAKQLIFDETKAIPKGLTIYGQKYEQAIDLKGANGRVISTPVIWIKNPDNVTRLVTLIPVDK